MVVFNRSNDMVWGCYGANAVHFSFLHEFIGRSTGLPLGTYTQVSVNLHAYIDGKMGKVYERTQELKRLPSEVINLL